MLQFLARYHILAYLICGYLLLLCVSFFYYPVKFFLYNIRIFLQKHIALFLSHVRLIDISKLDSMKREEPYICRLLQPGDLLFSRKIGYLSNYFIPGYFSHAMIYVGNRSSFSHTFNRVCIKTHGMPLEQYMRRNFPKIHSILKSHRHLILHATGDGVKLQHLMIESNIEGLCAIRAKMPLKDLFSSLLIAFENYGRAYDFSFDFASDDGLICSELLWTSFKKRKNKAGLSLRLIPFADVKNISPTPLLRQALYERTQDFPVRFVFFLRYNLITKQLRYYSRKHLLQVLRDSY